LDWEIVFWAVLAGLAFVGELLSVSFFLLFFSFGGLVALLAAFAGIGLVGQALGFVLASVLSMVVLRPALLNRLSLRGGEEYVGHRGITGESAVVTEAIEAGGKGTVHLTTKEGLRAIGASGSSASEAGASRRRKLAAISRSPPFFTCRQRT
jgi:membrane protein implicated in regulation of membrane protease activity